MKMGLRAREYIDAPRTQAAASRGGSISPTTKASMSPTEPFAVPHLTTHRPAAVMWAGTHLIWLAIQNSGKLQLIPRFRPNPSEVKLPCRILS